MAAAPAFSLGELANRASFGLRIPVTLCGMEPPPIRAELRIQSICMVTLTVLAVAFALDWLEPVMIPFVVSAFLAFALMPLVDSLETYARLPRTVAVCLALLLAVVVLVGMGMLMSISVAQFTSGENLTLYQRKLSQLPRDVLNFLPLNKFGVTADNLLADLRIPEGTVQSLLLQTTNAVTGVVSKSVLVLIFLFFLLLSSVKRDRPIGGAWGEVESQIRAYLITMTALSAVTGALVWAVLTILGVPGAALFGLLTFLLNFIPNVGSFIATLLPLPIVLVSGFSTTGAILAIAIPGAIQFFIGNFIQPKVMGNSMRLHPVVILMALIFWGMLWGFVGMFFAVPITSMIRIACDRHELTRPVADLMAGKLTALREEPPLAPLVAEAAPTPENDHRA
ncbi:MAG: AI-2E family transporter [Pirellulales bacterium]|nr:AI-2E family transporter [Pirellulales bacterium]